MDKEPEVSIPSFSSTKLGDNPELIDFILEVMDRKLEAMDRELELKLELTEADPSETVELDRRLALRDMLVVEAVSSGGPLRGWMVSVYS